jgi:hypothetical protein
VCWWRSCLRDHRPIAGKYIKELLFNPWVVCFSLIVGGKS